MPITNYIYDPVTEAYLMETDGDGNMTAWYTQEPVKYGDVLAQHRIDPTTGVGESFYYHTDALGSTRELTDSSGTVVNTYTYDAFGNTIASTGTVKNPFRFTGNVGYYFDEELDTYHIRARNYQPTTGRWTSQDPIGFAGGVNLYGAYFVPFSIDPSGNRVIICECRPKFDFHLTRTVEVETICNGDWYDCCVDACKGTSSWKPVGFRIKNPGGKPAAPSPYPPLNRIVPTGAGVCSQPRRVGFCFHVWIELDVDYGMLTTGVANGQTTELHFAPPQQCNFSGQTSGYTIHPRGPGIISYPQVVFTDFNASNLDNAALLYKWIEMQQQDIRGEKDCWSPVNSCWIPSVLYSNYGQPDKSGNHRTVPMFPRYRGNWK